MMEVEEASRIAQNMSLELCLVEVTALYTNFFPCFLEAA